MNRKAVFDDSGRTSESASEYDEECIDDEEWLIKSGKRARARELLSFYGW